jgi:hypothetical protein
MIRLSNYKQKPLLPSSFLLFFLLPLSHLPFLFSRPSLPSHHPDHRNRLVLENLTPYFLGINMNKKKKKKPMLLPQLQDQFTPYICCSDFNDTLDLLTLAWFFFRLWRFYRERTGEGKGEAEVGSTAASSLHSSFLILYLSPSPCLHFLPSFSRPRPALSPFLSLAPLVPTIHHHHHY